MSRSALFSFLVGGLAVGAGVTAVALDYPALTFLMLPAVPLSIIVGILARTQFRRSQGEVHGSGLAGWGIGLGLIGLAFLVILPAT